jgi:hypothetical protein
MMESTDKIRHASAQNPRVIVSQLYNFQEPPGTTFLVHINVSDVTDLTGFAMNLSWNPEIIRLSEGDPKGIVPLLNTTKFNVYLGDFLNTTYWGIESISNDKGWIKYLWGARATGTVSGSGVLAILNFTLIKTGTTKIEITGISNISPGKCMLISRNQEIAHDEIDGIVSNQPPPSPEFWQEPWFQIVIAIIIIVIAIAIVIRWGKQKIRIKRRTTSDEPIYEDTPPTELLS